MELEWDETKRLSNLEKHGIDFSELHAFFEDLAIQIPDTRINYGESRWIGLNEWNERITAVVFTYRSEDCIRLISARYASRKERSRYYEEINQRTDS